MYNVLSDSVSNPGLADTFVQHSLSASEKKQMKYATDGIYKKFFYVLPLDES